MIVKATEGKGYTAPTFAQYIAAVRAATARPGAYHYAWPENGFQADFDHFAAVAGLRVGEAYCLDFEPWPKSQPLADPKTFPAYVCGWADAGKARFGVDPLTYIPDVFVAQIKLYATAAQWARIAALPFFKAGVDGHYLTDPAAGFGDQLGFSTVAAWQWGDQPLDQDLLYVPWDTIAVKVAP